MAVAKSIQEIGKLSYAKCFALMSHRLHWRKNQKLGPNTYLGTDLYVGGRPTCFTVTFHDNKIMELHKDGRILLFDGGQRSVTTKERLRWLSGIRISQMNFQWYAGNLLFFNGMNVGEPQNERECIERDVRLGLMPYSVLDDWDRDNPGQKKIR